MDSIWKCLDLTFRIQKPLNEPKDIINPILIDFYICYQDFYGNVHRNPDYNLQAMDYPDIVVTLASTAWGKWCAAAPQALSWVQWRRERLEKVVDFLMNLFWFVNVVELHRLSCSQFPTDSFQSVHCQQSNSFQTRTFNLYQEQQFREFKSRIRGRKYLHSA